mmetsp:Transcript_9589/g.15680  ORF Transcript_9589/g.15680 Transcript_9589/m.15680 type:complete len:129 (-) Transcript_9589:435-821(-)
MKFCAACFQELPRESFSKKPWQLKQCQRRCDECFGTNREVQLKEPPEPSCWICLVEGPDESGHQLRRDCSYRSSSGSVHLSCTVEYANQKTENAKQKTDHSDCVDLPNCDQAYHDELAVDWQLNPWLM